MGVFPVLGGLDRDSNTTLHGGRVFPSFKRYPPSLGFPAQATSAADVYKKGSRLYGMTEPKTEIPSGVSPPSQPAADERHRGTKREQVGWASRAAAVTRRGRIVECTRSGRHVMGSGGEQGTGNRRMVLRLLFFFREDPHRWASCVVFSPVCWRSRYLERVAPLFLSTAAG